MRVRGKKFEVYYVSGFGEIEIRFDSDYSKFFAVFMDKTYENKDLNLLKTELKEVVSAADTTVWTPMILIELDSWKTRDAPFIIEKKMLGVNKTKTIVGSVRRLEGGEDEDWYDDPKNMVAIAPYSDYHPEEDKYIPYTIEKWRALQLVIQKMEELREKLRDIVMSDQGEKFLENLYKNRDEVKLISYDEGRKE